MCVCVCVCVCVKMGTVYIYIYINLDGLSPFSSSSGVPGPATDSLSSQFYHHAP